MKACPTCQSQILPGSFFCDSCGASVSQGSVVARKLRQSSFTTVTKASGNGLLSPGEIIKGRRSYIIEEAVARSGFGATFRAHRVRDEKQVLIKQMLDQSSYDQYRAELMKSFKREAKFLRRLHHPAFPRGFEYFIRNGSFYLVMEFINGKELAKAIDEYREKNGAIEDGLLVYIGIEIADALDVVHSYGYIYRDLKPQNIMLDGISSRVKMIDFGTLYHPSDSNPLLFESEGYTPPELMEKDKKFVPSADIYGLGALLYEAATGDVPSEFGDTSALDRSKRDHRLCEIIEKCLAKKPEDRYQRAKHVRDDLYKLTRGGIWPFTNRNKIEPIELSVLPKTLFPSQCTYCEYCGHADSKSQVGYCPKCRVPLRVATLSLEDKQGSKGKEFFLYADETTIGSSSQAHFALDDPSGEVLPQHFRVFRRNGGLWLEAIGKDSDSTLVNQRKIIGPVELIDGDAIRVAGITLRFTLKDAC